MAAIDVNRKTYELDITMLKQGRFFIAYSPALDLSSCGTTKEKALKMIKEAIEIFLQEIDGRKTTQSVLTQLGWKIRSPFNFQPPETLHTKVSVKYAQDTKLKV